MKCKNCGNDLPEEASFCPYCMSKLTKVDQIVQDKKSVNRNKLAIFIAISAIAVVSVIAVLILMLARSSDEKSNTNVNTTTSTSSIEVDSQTETDEQTKTDGQINSDGEKIDKNENDKPTLKEEETTENIIDNPYDYCGTWYDDDFTGEDPMLEGGNILKIISMTKDSVIFDLCSYQSPPMSREAMLSGIEADIVDGKAEFIFGDDGWGNGGYGTLLFLDGEIYVHIVLTTVSSDSLWNIRTDVKFKKVGDSYENRSIDFMGVIGEDVSVALVMLSNEPYELEPNGGGSTYRFGGITMETYERKITSILVEYERFPEGYRDIFTFSFGINGKAKFHYVEGKLGDCLNTYKKDDNYVNIFRSPEQNETFIEITYSRGEVVSIRYFMYIE